MKKLTKEQTEKVEKCRKRVNQLSHKQELLYEILLQETGMEDSGWLFDYIFNCHIDDLYYNTVKREIFGHGEE
jgi:hypothetical protein